MKSILRTEENVLNIYQKLSSNQEISHEELDKKKRFYELVNANE